MQTISGGVPNNRMKLLFVEMSVGYDQHGQDVTSAAMKACKNAISSNSIPAFRRGSIPGVSFGEMKLQIKLGVPHSLHQQLDLDKVKSIFPYGKIVNVEVVDGGLICSSGVVLQSLGVIKGGSRLPGQPPPDSDPAVRGNASHLTSDESESDSVIGPGYNAVESRRQFDSFLCRKALTQLI